MTAPNELPFPLPEPWEGIPPHVVLLHDLWGKHRTLCRLHRLPHETLLPTTLFTVPGGKGPAWDRLIERKLIELVRYCAPSGEAPWSEYEVHAFTEAGIALLRAYGW